MKTKTLTLFSLASLTLLIIYSCNVTNGSVSTLNNTICSNYTDMSTLEVDLIRTMTNKYKDNQLSDINDSSHTPFTIANGDTRAIWFDLETLKAFIHQIEIKAKNNATPVQSKDLGIRIYYASYPDSAETYNDLNGVNGNYILPSIYQEHHTLVMIPTINRRVGNVNIDADFNPSDPATYIKPISSVYSTNPSAQIPALTGVRSSSSNNTGAQNHGSLAPPHTNSSMSF
ncbi:MAG: hypothetical protein KUG68_10180 [Flavobacteriaceae bacterium]|nr:hypothetical protein [Flavobacteriaceae bacterium]